LVSSKAPSPAGWPATRLEHSASPAPGKGTPPRGRGSDPRTALPLAADRGSPGTASGWGERVEAAAHRDALELRLVEQVVQFILGGLYLLLVGGIHHVPAREGTALSTGTEVPAPRCCAGVHATTKPCAHGRRVASPAPRPVRGGDG